MFEKEAEEYIDKLTRDWSDGEYSFSVEELRQAILYFAEFGYNKANKWKYPSKGEYPKDEENFRSYVVAYYGAKGSVANGNPCWEELCWNTEHKRWVEKETLDDLPYVNKEGIVIAWKEIVLPKDSE
jgi:hypothetical protein